jgi:hypothetical protein
VQLVEYPHLGRFGTLSRLLFLGPYLHPPDFLSGCDLPAADAGMVRFLGTELIVFVGPDGCDSFLAFTHLAFVPAPFSAAKQPRLFRSAIQKISLKPESHPACSYAQSAKRWQLGTRFPFFIARMLLGSHLLKQPGGSKGITESIGFLADRPISSAR